MPATHCEGCAHFRPDPLNPPSGVGQCLKDNGYWHPTAPHLCKQREAAQ